MENAELLNTMDADALARHFCQLNSASDLATMRAWFASAIEIGRTAGARHVEIERDNALRLQAKVGDLKRQIADHEQAAAKLHAALPRHGTSTLRYIDKPASTLTIKLAHPSAQQDYLPFLAEKALLELIARGIEYVMTEGDCYGAKNGVHIEIDTPRAHEPASSLHTPEYKAQQEADNRAARARLDAASTLHVEQLRPDTDAFVRTPDPAHWPFLTPEARARNESAIAQASRSTLDSELAAAAQDAITTGTGIAQTRVEIGEDGRIELNTTRIDPDTVRGFDLTLTMPKRDGETAESVEKRINATMEGKAGTMADAEEVRDAVLTGTYDGKDGGILPGAQDTVGDLGERNRFMDFVPGTTISGTVTDGGAVKEPSGDYVDQRDRDLGQEISIGTASSVPAGEQADENRMPQSEWSVTDIKRATYHAYRFLLPSMDEIERMVASGKGLKRVAVTVQIGHNEYGSTGARILQLTLDDLRNLSQPIS